MILDKRPLKRGKNPHALMEMQLIKKQFKEIQKTLEALKYEANSQSTLILVEGIKDQESLIKLKINGNFLYLKGQNITEVCDYASTYKKVIILTDFDTFGLNYAKKIRQNLSSRGIEADLSYYQKLKFYFKKVSKDIESISKIYEEVEQGSKDT